MAIALTGHGEAASTGSSVSAWSFSNFNSGAIAVNDLIIYSFYISMGGSTVPAPSSITDGAGNTYTGDFHNAANGDGSGIYYAVSKAVVAANSLAISVSISLTSSFVFRNAIATFNGAPNGWATDGTPGVATSSGTSLAVSMGSATVEASASFPDLVFATIGDNSAGTGTYTYGASSGFIAQSGAFGYGWKSVTTNATQSYTFTISPTSSVSYGHVLAFNVLAVPPSAPTISLSQAGANDTISYTASTAGTNAIAGYALYQGTSPSSLSQVTTNAGSGAGSFVRQGPATGNSYYQVRAYDNQAIAEYSAPSNTLSSSPQFHASYTTSGKPTSLSGGQTVTYSVTATNTGSGTWQAASNTVQYVRLGTHFSSIGGGNPSNIVFGSDIRYTLASDVPYNSSATISVTVAPPYGALPGTYTLEDQMVLEPSTWFSNFNDTFIYISRGFQSLITEESSALAVSTPTLPYAIPMPIGPQETISVDAVSRFSIGARSIPAQILSIISDLVGRSKGNYRSPGDILSAIGDNINRLYRAVRTPQETIGSIDLLNRTSIIGRSLVNEVLPGIVSGTGRIIGFGRGTIEAVPVVVGNISRIYGAIRGPIETIVVTALLSRSYGPVRGTFETIGTVASASATIIRNLTAGTTLPQFIDAPRNLLGSALDTLPSFTDVGSLVRHRLIALATADWMPATVTTILENTIYHRTVIQQSILVPTVTPTTRLGAAPPAILVSVNSSDLNGQMTFGTGNGAIAGIILHVAFNAPHVGVSTGRLSLMNQASINAGLSITNITSTGFDIQCTSLLVNQPSTTYSVWWQIS